MPIGCQVKGDFRVIAATSRKPCLGRPPEVDRRLSPQGQRCGERNGNAALAGARKPSGARQNRISRI